MPDLNDYIENIKRLRVAFEKKLPEIATGLTLTAKALAERNAHEVGFGETYSTNPIPAWFLEGKEINNAGKTFIQKKVKAKKEEDRYTTWGELKAAEGLPVGHVTASHSNKTWAGMTPLEVIRRGNVYSAPLGGNNEEVQKVMNYLREMYGDYVGKCLSEKEFNIMAEYVFSEFGKLVKEAGIIVDIKSINITK